MQGDIMLPSPPKRRPAPKAKIPKMPAGLPPDIVIDETIPADDKNSRRLFIPPPKHFLRFWRWWRKLDRNERFAAIAAVLLILGAGAIGWFYFMHPDSNPSIAISKYRHRQPRPATSASPLSGLQVEPALAKRPVTGIMIENSDSARPQSGLQDAGVVYEAVAEGGITRFMALFQEGQPQYIGPVRSLRPYFLDLAAPFLASIVHVGGSPDALNRVRSGSYRDLDQFFNSGAFTRIGTRPAPHNVYTSFAKLDALNQAKGYNGSIFTSWPRKPDKKLAAPTARTIDFSISSPDFYAHYDYDAPSNTYLRSEGGAPHTNLANAGDKAEIRLQPKVVIALVMDYSIASDGQHSEYADTGTGPAYVFQDGGASLGSWEKSDVNSQLLFKDSAGAAIKLNAGQTWITLVGGANKVSYKP